MQEEFLVDELDIDESDWFNIRNCPMARCLKRHFPDAKDIQVGYYGAVIDGVDYKIMCSVPITEIISTIDRKIPFTFKMEQA